MLNLTVNCNEAIRGTGVNGCQKAVEYVSRFILIQSGYKFLINNDTFDDATINELIQKGIMLVMPRQVNLEVTGGTEPIYEEYQAGAKSFVRYVPYEFKITYDGFICLGNSLQSRSAKKWDVLWVDDSGHLVGEVTSDGYFKGFGTTLTIFEGRTFNDGKVASKNMFRIQLSNSGTTAVNSYIDYVTSEEVDFKNLNGIDEVVITNTSGNTTATNLKIKVTYSCDGSTAITGLTSKFRVLDSTGAVVSGVTFTYVSDGVYSVAGLTAGDYRINLYDTALDSNVVILADSFYKSNTLTISLT
jgi:hypothetical protein